MPNRRFPGRAGTGPGGVGVPAQPEVPEGSHPPCPAQSQELTCEAGLSLLFTHQTAATSRTACPAGESVPVPADSPTGSLCGPGSVPTQAAENCAPFGPGPGWLSVSCASHRAEQVPKVPPSALPTPERDTAGQRPAHSRTDVLLHPQCTGQQAGPGINHGVPGGGPRRGGGGAGQDCVAPPRTHVPEAAKQDHADRTCSGPWPSASCLWPLTPAKGGLWVRKPGQAAGGGGAPREAGSWLRGRVPARPVPATPCAAHTPLRSQSTTLGPCPGEGGRSSVASAEPHPR